MSISVVAPTSIPRLAARRNDAAHSPGLHRALVILACLAAMAAAFWWSGTLAPSTIEADLARLLRGMALLKGSIALAAVGVLLWRFGHPTPPRMAAAYIAGAALIAGASVLIWQLVHIPAAAIAFHVGEFTLLIAAWRDRDGVRAIRHASA